MDLVTINNNYSNLLTAVSTIILAGVTLIYVRIVKKQATVMYNNLEYQMLMKEMDYLIGPLFSKKTDKILFGDSSLSYRPQRNNADTSWNWKVYYEFWDSIKTHMYLSTPEVVSALDDYFTARQNYWNGREDKLCSSFKKTPDGRLRISEFEKKRSELNSQVYNRYKMLMNELKEKRRT